MSTMKNKTKKGEKNNKLQRNIKDIIESSWYLTTGSNYNKVITPVINYDFQKPSIYFKIQDSDLGDETDKRTLNLMTRDLSNLIQTLEKLEENFNYSDFSTAKDQRHVKISGSKSFYLLATTTKNFVDIRLWMNIKDIDKIKPLRRGFTFLRQQIQEVIDVFKKIEEYYNIWGIILKETVYHTYLTLKKIVNDYRDTCQNQLGWYDMDDDLNDDGDRFLYHSRYITHDEFMTTFNEHIMDDFKKQLTKNNLNKKDLWISLTSSMDYMRDNIETRKYLAYLYRNKC